MKLTETEAGLVKAMLARGDKQHDIAGFFGVNGGRIAEIKTGAKFGAVKPAAKKDLPLSSALGQGVAVFTVRQALARAKAGIEAAERYLDGIEASRDIPS